MKTFVELWNTDSHLELWQAFLLVIFVTFNFGLFCVSWFLRKAALLEYGYPKRKAKTLNKRFKEYSFLEKLFLVKVVKDSDQKGFYSYLLLILNFANIVAFFSCVVGYIAVLLTCISEGIVPGWATVLVLIPVFGVFLGSFAITFIPDLIYLPSERRRYKWK